MTTDTRQLTARFRESFDTASSQVLTPDKVGTAVNRAQPWCSFSVSVGARRREESGVNPTYLQLGGVTLQVFIPKPLGLSAGDPLLQKFDDAMTGWRSADGALTVGQMSRTQEDRGDHYQVNIRFAWQSLRRRGE